MTPAPRKRGEGRPRLLDLFCGAGGAAAGYADAGFEVVGVDYEPQPNYPFEFRLMEWDEAPEHEFDAIHASPPCQAFSAYRRKGHGVGDKASDLIGDVRDVLELSGLPWIIENVPGAPLHDPIQLCGSSFRLDVRRHRLFESSVELGRTSPPCDHEWQTPRFPQATNRKNLRSTVEVGVWRIPLAVQQAAMGIDWMSRKELSQAIPPAYTEWIGRRLIKTLP